MHAATSRTITLDSSAVVGMPSQAFRQAWTRWSLKSLRGAGSFVTFPMLPPLLRNPVSFVQDFIRRNGRRYYESPRREGVPTRADLFAQALVRSDAALAPPWVRTSLPIMLRNRLRSGPRRSAGPRRSSHQPISELREMYWRTSVWFGLVR